MFQLVVEKALGFAVVAEALKCGKRFAFTHIPTPLLLGPNGQAELWLHVSYQISPGLIAH
jgi:hypothetical protein